MRNRLFFGAPVLAVLLSSCATVSFAPPNVDLAKKTEIGSGGDQSCLGKIQPTGTAITEDVDGARYLINNFIYVYRCRAQEAANGRQAFEIPQMLALAGGAIASAYGAGANVAIGTGAGGAVFGQGKSYYDPKQKAVFYDHALDALLCIKTEAVGITSFSTDTTGKSLAELMSTGGNTVTVSANHRYFDMVSAALFSVERILAQRLSSTGTFDPAGLVAEIEAVQKKVKDAEDKAKGTPAPTPAPAPAPPPSPSPAPAPSPGASPPPDTAMTEALKALQMALSSSGGGSDYTLQLDVLQPRLQQCVLRAKL